MSYRRRYALLPLTGLLASAVAGRAYARQSAAFADTSPGATTSARPGIEDPADRLAALLARYRSRPRDPELCMAVGKEEAALGQYPAALTMFRRASALDPKRVSAYLGQGQAWMKLGRPGKSVEAYEQAARLMPNQPLIELELANSYLELRDFKIALEHAQKARKLDESNPEIYAALGNIYSGSGDLTNTLGSAEKALALAPQDDRYWTEAGVLAYGIRRFPEAVRYLRRALEINPRNANAGVALADTLYQMDQTPASRAEIHRLLTRAITLQPREPRGLYLLGHYYLEEQQLDLAVPTLRRALRWQPDAHEVMLALGQALTRRGQGEEGRTLVAQAQKEIDRTVDFRGLEFQAASNPNPDVHLRLAVLYRRNGRYDSALHTVDRGLRLAPGDARLRSMRADLLGHPPPPPKED